MFTPRNPLPIVDSRFNTCTHVNEEGLLDCDDKVYMKNRQFCEKHFFESVGVFSNDPELNKAIRDWRKKLNA